MLYFQNEKYKDVLLGPLQPGTLLRGLENTPQADSWRQESATGDDQSQSRDFPIENGGAPLLHALRP